MDPGLALQYGMHDGNNTRGCSCHACTNNPHGEARLHDMIPEDGKRDLYDAAAHREANEKNLSPIRWKQKALIDQQQNKSSMNLENGKTLDEHIIEFEEPDIISHGRNDPNQLGKVYTNSYSSNYNHSSERKGEVIINKRVTLHHLDKNRTSIQGQHGKLIILPDSLEELLKIAGKHQLINNLKMRKVI